MPQTKGTKRIRAWNPGGVGKRRSEDNPGTLMLLNGGTTKVNTRKPGGQKGRKPKTNGAQKAQPTRRRRRRHNPEALRSIFTGAVAGVAGGLATKTIARLIPSFGPWIDAGVKGVIAFLLGLGLEHFKIVGKDKALYVSIGGASIAVGDLFALAMNKLALKKAMEEQAAAPLAVAPNAQPATQEQVHNALAGYLDAMSDPEMAGIIERGPALQFGMGGLLERPW